MGLLDRVAQERLVRASLSGPPAAKAIWGSDWQNFMGMGTDGSGITEITDQQTDFAAARTAESYVYRCEEVRGRAISQVPLKAWETDRQGARKAIDHDVLSVLSETNPIGYVDGAALLRYTLNSLDLHGRCAWRLIFNRKGQPAEIYWQVPTQWVPLPDPKTFFWGIRVFDEGGVREIPAKELCYFATDNPADPLQGTSKIKVLRAAINLRQYSSKSNLDFFKNSMRPDWILSGSWANTQENIDRLRREVRRHLTGANNRAPLFLGEGATAHLLTTSHEDAQWLEQQRLSQEEISAAFGVPIIYLNNLERATYENIKTAKLILWHDTMIPEGDILADLLNRRLLWKYWPEDKARRISLGFDYDEIEGLGEDLALIWERVVKMSQQISQQVERRELTPNQARLIRDQLFGDLGIDTSAFTGDVPGGDTFYVRFQEIPIEEASVQANIDIAAARGQNPQLEQDVPGAPTIADQAEAPDPDRAKAAQIIDLEELRRSVVAEAVAAAKAQQVVTKGPHPLPIRDARLAPIQERLQKRLKRHFQDLQTQALRVVRGEKALKQGPPGQELYDVAQSQQELTALIEEGVTAAGEAAYLASLEEYSLKVVWDGAAAWLEQYMGMRLPLIKGIDDNLRDRLRTALLASAEEGDSIPEIASAVREVFKEAIESRSLVIARTETIQAYGHASIQSYREAGIESAQMYDGPNADSADCINVNGQVVSLADAERLMTEEHPNGTRGVAPYLGSVELGASSPVKHLISKELLYTTGRRSPAHDHSTEAGGRPTIVLDLHGTITPSDGFTAPGQPGSMLPPFDGCREGLDLLVAGGCCLHLCTAALSPYHPPDILAARRQLVDAYLTAYGLPISFVSGKVGAHVYYDDRMVRAEGDWQAIMERVLAKLARRFEMDEAGILRRKDIPDVGDPVDTFPDDEDSVPDQPRGFSTPVLDVDLHRCLFQASSSKLESGLKPGALASVSQIYQLGYTVNLSCAGWDPATHPAPESAQRLASLRRQARSAGVPYDEMVSKDHPDVAIDDKGIEHTTWEADLPMLLVALGTPHPEDEVTLRSDEPGADQTRNG